MKRPEGFSIEYVSPSVVRNGNDFAIVYREGEAKIIIVAEAYRASATSTKYEIKVPGSFLEKGKTKQLSAYGKECLMRIRQFIDNEVFDFKVFGVPEIGLDENYGLPGWNLPDGKPYEKALLVKQEKNTFVIKHGGLSSNTCSFTQCSNRALRGEAFCVDHFMCPLNARPCA